MRHLKADVLRLTATYLTIIMVMSIGFSFVLYGVSAQQLDRPRPHDRFTGGYLRQDIDDYLVTRANEGKNELRFQLVALNILALLIGGLLSYLLAERTLRPIEDNMEAQAQFVSDASHELRTPLAALMAANEVALRSKKLTLAEAKAVLQGNIADVTRLQQLTASLLDLLRDRPETYVKEQVNIQSVVADAMSSVAAQAIAKYIAVDDQTGRTVVYGNHQALVQVLTILLDNAIKYSPEHSTVRVTSETSNKRVVVAVIDQGIGIDAESLPHVFTRFYRADKARARQDADGYGLGLAIAKNIVKAHQGKLEVSSKPGEGSTFSVSLPAA